MLSGIIIIFILLSYLTGALPSAVWIGRVFYNIDVREYGSGNAGATNTFRVLGFKAGFPVLILDILKGWIAVNYAIFFTESNFTNICNYTSKINYGSEHKTGMGGVIKHEYKMKFKECNLTKCKFHDIKFIFEGELSGNFTETSFKNVNLECNLSGKYNKTTFENCTLNIIAS